MKHVSPYLIKNSTTLFIYNQIEIIRCTSVFIDAIDAFSIKAVGWMKNTKMQDYFYNCSL